MFQSNPVLHSSLGFKVCSSPPYVDTTTKQLPSSSVLAIHSICASHLILSIQSLASDMGSDPTFLLSNIEISRVAWRRGSTANELIVEVGDAEAPLELIDLDPLASDLETLKKQSSRRTIRASRVGVYDARSAHADLGFRTYTYSR